MDKELTKEQAQFWRILSDTNPFNSVIFNTDSYKVSMWKQYPKNTTGIYSYIESRGGRFDRTVFFGLQAFIKEYLTKPITQREIDLAEKLFFAHGEPFNKEGWEYILKEHNGYLPVRIKAVPEGTVVPVLNVLATIENTDPKCFWLTTWLETALLRAIWYPTTVATQSWHIRQLIKSYLEDTGDVSGLDFKLHDFGARGVNVNEGAIIGGMAHLINFNGTDTVMAMAGAMMYYNAPLDPAKGICPAYSIPAAEHSTITSWGRENEVEAYRNMLKQFAKPGALLAVVSDSFDIFNAADKLWGDMLRQEVVDSGAIVVIRPDSGDPVSVCTKLVQILGNKFGYTTNAKGFKVLNNVRIIQGDGNSELSIRSILGAFMALGWSADNIAFGMGGALLQQLDRDTQKFAMKCSAAEINGEWVAVSKDPVTDKGKRSKGGRVTLYYNSTMSKDGTNTFWSGVEDWEKPALETVFENGKLVKETTFDEVRAVARAA